jgi:hypothetical protein
VSPRRLEEKALLSHLGFGCAGLQLVSDDPSLHAVRFSLGRNVRVASKRGKHSRRVFRWVPAEGIGRFEQPRVLMQTRYTLARPEIVSVPCSSWRWSLVLLATTTKECSMHDGRGGLTFPLFDASWNKDSGIPGNSVRAAKKKQNTIDKSVAKTLPSGSKKKLFSAIWELAGSTRSTAISKICVSIHNHTFHATFRVFFSYRFPLGGFSEKQVAEMSGAVPNAQHFVYLRIRRR